MIIVDFTLNHSILLKALGHVPNMEITWVRSNATDNSRVRFTVWAEGDDFRAFEQALDSDPTVTLPLRMNDFIDRRLYQLELTDEGLQKSVYPVFVESGGMIQKLTATHEGWEFRVVFPDQASLSYFYEFSRENKFEMTVHRLYEERDRRKAQTYGLTDRQRETLVEAIESGYLEIPRESSLAELGDRLDISENAASERFRRAVQTLIKQTVYSPEDIRKSADEQAVSVLRED